MKMLLSSALALGIAAAAVPAVADSVDGVVASFDGAENRLKLQSGQWFELSAGIKMRDLESGDRVTVEYDHYQNGYPLANQITVKENGEKTTLPK